MSTIKLTVSDSELFSALVYTGCTDEMASMVVKERDRFEALGLSNAHRWAMFIGQCAHESAHFSTMEENLNYSEGALMRTWPSRYKTSALAKADARKPKNIAMRVYGGRMGNTSPEEGWLYRGRGPIMITGHDNYEKCGRFLKLDLLGQPDLLAEHFDIGLLSALWYFNSRRLKGKTLLEWCDALSYKNTTKLINGGYIGLADRTSNVRGVLSIFSQDEGVYTRPLMRKGDKGQHIKELQVHLKTMGYVRAADGVFGNGTLKAIRSFQADNKLTVDGIVGGKTFRLILVLAYRKSLEG